MPFDMSTNEHEVRVRLKLEEGGFFSELSAASRKAADYLSQAATTVSNSAAYGAQAAHQTYAVGQTAYNTFKNEFSGHIQAMALATQGSPFSGQARMSENMSAFGGLGRGRFSYNPTFASYMKSLIVPSMIDIPEGVQPREYISALRTGFGERVGEIAGTAGYYVTGGAAEIGASYLGGVAGTKIAARLATRFGMGSMASGILGGALGIAGGIGAATAVGSAVEYGHERITDYREISRFLGENKRSLFSGALGGAGEYGSNQRGDIARNMVLEGAGGRLEFSEIKRALGTFTQSDLMGRSSTIRQFEQKFKENLKSMKEIMDVLNVSADTAMGFMRQNAQSGFKSTSDMQRVTLLSDLASRATGMPITAVTGLGAQMGATMQAMGYQKRTGYELAMGNAIGIAGMQAGGGANVLSAIGRAGGAQSAAMSLSQFQAGLAQTSQMDIMMAYMFDIDPKTGRYELNQKRYSDIASGKAGINQLEVGALERLGAPGAAAAFVGMRGELPRALSSKQLGVVTERMINMQARQAMDEMNIGRLPALRFVLGNMGVPSEQVPFFTQYYIDPSGRERNLARYQMEQEADIEFTRLRRSQSLREKFRRDISRPMGRFLTGAAMGIESAFIKPFSVVGESITNFLEEAFSGTNLTSRQSRNVAGIMSKSYDRMIFDRSKDESSRAELNRTLEQAGILSSISVDKLTPTEKIAIAKTIGRSRGEDLDVGKISSWMTGLSQSEIESIGELGFQVGSTPTQIRRTIGRRSVGATERVLGENLATYLSRLRSTLLVSEKDLRTNKKYGAIYRSSTEGMDIIRRNAGAVNRYASRLLLDPKGSSLRKLFSENEDLSGFFAPGLSQEESIGRQYALKQFLTKGGYDPEEIDQIFDIEGARALRGFASVVDTAEAPERMQAARGRLERNLSAGYLAHLSFSERVGHFFQSGAVRRFQDAERIEMVQSGISAMSRAARPDQAIKILRRSIDGPLGESVTYDEFISKQGRSLSKAIRSPAFQKAFGISKPEDIEQNEEGIKRFYFHYQKSKAKDQIMRDLGEIQGLDGSLSAEEASAKEKEEADRLSQMGISQGGIMSEDWKNSVSNLGLAAERLIAFADKMDSREVKDMDSVPA